MDQRDHSPPVPIDGAVFARSEVSTLGLIALYGILGLLGWCIFFSPKLGIKRLFVGIIMMVVGPLQILREAGSWWVRRRLIVGSDCIQVIEHRGGEDRVVLQIPYANIADFKYEDNPRRVWIDLYQLDDPNTYAPSENFKSNRQSNGRHYSIQVGYRIGPRAIADEIEEAYSNWVEERA
jgi:hypothetical protein